MEDFDAKVATAWFVSSLGWIATCLALIAIPETQESIEIRAFAIAITVICALSSLYRIVKH